jgi:GNAT superfamily N-acetyltransferase
VSRVYKIVVTTDSTTTRVSKAFDYVFTGERVFEGFDKPKIPVNFKIGLIVGPSGSGKSLLLKEFGEERKIVWNKNKAIVSQFLDSDQALDRLMAVGLSSTPSWCSPFHILSTGEQFRANLARRLENNTVIDEFTSVVDRNVAKAACVGLRRYVDKHNIHSIVLASCHYDILEWLRPDWYFDTRDGILHDGRLLRRPEIEVKLYPCKRSAWELFKKHHYLTSSLATSSDCYLATALFDSEESVVGFASAIPLPSGTLENAWRGHRLVVLPDFQGLGIGPRLSDALAQMYVDKGCHYYSRTAHPRLGMYRDRPDSGWRRTTESGKHRAASRIRAKGKTDLEHGMGDSRICFSHEYIGTASYQNWWEV